MAKKKKKKPAKGNVIQSPVRYIKTKCRELPIKECLINTDWQEGDMANIVVAREQPSGKLIVGMYLVDLLCLGVKNTFYYYSMDTFEYDNLVRDIKMNLDTEPCDYVLAHNIIYGALEFAEELGIKPHKDFGVTRYILAEDDESVAYMDLEFGQDGKPMLIVREGMNAAPYIASLRKSVGEGNYEVMFDDEILDMDEDFDADDDFGEDRPFRALIADYAEKLQEENLNQPHGEPRHLQMHQYQITFDVVPSQYDQYYQDRLDEVKEAAKEAYTMTIEKPKEAIALNKKYIDKYPQFPPFYSHLANSYRLSGDLESSDKISKEMREKFPDYLFGRIAYAHVLLDEARYDEAIKVFDNNYSLDHIYPERQVFHFSEVLSFNLFLCRYFLETDRLDAAISYYQIMLGIEENNNLTLTAENLVGKEVALKELEMLNTELEKEKKK